MAATCQPKNTDEKQSIKEQKLVRIVHIVKAREERGVCSKLPMAYATFTVVHRPRASKAHDLDVAIRMLVDLA